MPKFVKLGENFGKSAPIPEPPPAPSPAEVAAERLLVAVSELKEALAGFQPPPVQLDTTALADVVNAVTDLKGPATADDIAQAIARELHIPQPTDPSGVLADLSTVIRDLHEKLDFRLQGLGRAFGSSGPSNIASDPNREIGRVSNFPSDYPDTNSAALLTTIRDTVLRRTDPIPAGTNNIGDVDVVSLPALPAGTNNIGDVDIASAIPTGSNIIGFVSPTVSKKAGEAKFFIADSGQIATTVTNNWCNFTFENPSSSGKNAYLVAVTLEFDTTVFARFYRAPTTNLPTTSKTAYNAVNIASSAPYASSMLVKSDASAGEMNNATTLVSRVTNNTGVRLDLPPMIITPGTIVGFGGNLGGTGNASVAVYWYEEAA